MRQSKGHPDQALKAFALEMEHLMRKHNVCGFFAIASPEAAEFDMTFAPWSAAQFERDPDGHVGLRIKAKKEEREKIEATFHALYSMRDMAIEHARSLANICAGIEHKYPGMVHHTPLRDNDTFRGDEAEIR